MNIHGVSDEFNKLAVEPVDKYIPELHKVFEYLKYLQYLEIHGYEEDDDYE